MSQVSIVNKSSVTNTVAVAILVASFYCPYYPEQLFSIGVFALAGAITNWLAVYMLFEKVPLLYGSGVIPNRFEEFKGAIKNLVMEQFFSKENVEQFFNAEKKGEINFDSVIEAIDFERLFENLVDAIMASSFGGMLGMFGGRDALDPLKEPVIEKLKVAFHDMAQSDSVVEALKKKFSAGIASKDVVGQIESIVDKRLNELTPQHVKEIVQKMIRAHLGWLVVWGGVFGGAIGLAVNLIEVYV